jgi:methyl-accepting chemotaxis protein
MLTNMKLSTRMGLGFGVILLLLVIIAVVVFISMNSLQATLTEIVEVNMKKQNLCWTLSASVDMIAAGVEDMIVAYDDEGIEAANKKLVDARTIFDATWNELEILANSDAEKDIREKIDEGVTTGRPLNNQVMEYAKADRDREAAELFFGDAGAAMDLCKEGCADGVAFQNEENQKAAERAKNQYNTTLAVIVSLCAASVVLGVLIAVFISRSISGNINRISVNLTEGAEQVASASNQLASTSQQLAQGNAEQASSIEETSSTLEESASMIQQNTENTRQAALLASQAKETSDKGNEEMKQMMDSMSEIKKSSDQIAKIIKVIDDIAFQTNILALNAAVEAARAGDAGMGFAVVAEEVRNLAQRSAQAAKDTAAMIENNIELSEKGVNIAGQVGKSLAEITVQAKKVKELLDDIAAASQEQSQGISQINKALAQMEQVTQQNAANAEESASASQELSAQAQILRDIVYQLAILVKGKSDKSVNERETGTRSNNYIAGADKHNGKLAGVSRKKLPKADSFAKNEDKKTYQVNPEDIIPLDSDTDDF